MHCALQATAMHPQMLAEHCSLENAGASHVRRAIRDSGLISCVIRGPDQHSTSGPDQHSTSACTLGKKADAGPRADFACLISWIAKRAVVAHSSTRRAECAVVLMFVASDRAHGAVGVTASQAR